MTRRHFSSVAQKGALSLPVSAGATVWSVTTTTGWPTSFPFTLVCDRGLATEEVVEATGVAGLSVTVTRGVDGTSAIGHSAGATVEHGVSARDYDEANSHANASSGVHGLSGSVVGTTDVQTLTNKTFTDLTVTNGITAGYSTPGSTASRPVAPPAGTLRYNTDTSTLQLYTGSAWVEANASRTPTATQWRAVNFAGNTFGLGKVAYGNGVFVGTPASGASSNVYTSTDGVTWTLRSGVLSASITPTGVFFVNGRFLITCGGNNGLFTSTDGVSWSLVAAGNNFTSVVWFNNLYIATTSASGSSVYTSPDLTTWTPRNMPIAAQWLYLTAGATKVVASVVDTGDATHKIAYSSDGLTWAWITGWGGGTGAYPQSIATNGSRFIATVGGGGSVALVVSDDGIDWSSLRTPYASSPTWVSSGPIVYANGTFMAWCKLSGSLVGVFQLLSADGDAWSVRPWVTDYVPSSNVSCSAYGTGTWAVSTGASGGGKFCAHVSP